MKRYAVSLLLLLTVSLNLTAKEVIKVATFPIPLMVVDENNGIFVELMQAIAKKADMKLELTIKPPKRILKEFFKGKHDALFPALDVTFTPENQPIKSSETVYVKRDFAFTRKGEPVLSSIKDLEGKKVGLTRGYPYVKELLENKNIDIQYANIDEENAKKLIAKRFDAFIVEEKSGLKAFENTVTLDKIQYNSLIPLSSQDVFFAFFKNDKNTKLEKKWSKALSQIKKDGTFGKIMSKAK